MIRWLEPLIQLLRDLLGAWRYLREQKAEEKRLKDEIEQEKVDAWRKAIADRDRSAALRALGGRVQHDTKKSDQRH